MVATGAGTRVDVTLKLSQLQNLCKRDPEGYREDYDAQARRLESECALLRYGANPNNSSNNNSAAASSAYNHLVELIQFCAAVSSSSYKGKPADHIATLLKGLLLGQDLSESSTSSSSSSSSSFQFLLSVPALQLPRDVRKACVSALILMRNKGSVEPLGLWQLFFRLMACIPHDKALRELLYYHIVNDIKNINKPKQGKKKNHGNKEQHHINKTIQTFLHRVVDLERQTHHPRSSSSSSSSSQRHSPSNDDDSATAIAVKRATEMVCELYRRGVWTDDDRAVAILASSVASRHPAVMARAIRFFLHIEDKMAEDSKQEEKEEWDGINGSVNLHQHSKKSKSRMRQTVRQLKNRQKAQKKREGQDEDWLELETKGAEHIKKLYPAIEMLRDPQGLAETVFQRLKSNNAHHKFELKLLMINFVTRLVGNHELLLLPLYPFLQRYLGGHQRDVTSVLACAVQACHKYVPPEEIWGILKTIAHNFITERCSEEQMAVGINAARAVCARVPSVLSTEDHDGDEQQARSGVVHGTDVEAFVRDLAGYAKHRDRSVAIAGKGWTNFIRETHPGLLQGKDRGLEGSALHKNGAKPLRYGQQEVALGVEGADLLVEYESKKKQRATQQDSTGDDWISDDDNDDDIDDGIEEVPMNDEILPAGGGNKQDEEEEEEEENNVEEEEEEEEKNDGHGDDDDEWKDVAEQEPSEDSDDEEAPTLVVLQDGKVSHQDEKDGGADGDDDNVIDVSKMSVEERNKLKMSVSSNRVFTTADFVKMRKLVERENRAKRDPREAARRKRAIAQGREFDDLSDDDDSDGSDDDNGVHITGAVNPDDIMAESKKKRMNKAERLESIILGREKFEAKGHGGGSTNTEKKRKKNFMMSKYSYEARSKRKGKTALKMSKSEVRMQDGKKRRRKK